MVFVTFGVGKYAGKLVIPDPPAIREMLKMRMERPSIKMVAHHYCVNKTFGSRAVEAGMRLFLDREHRNRLLTHRGNAKEILFRLQTFGIPTHELPVNENETIELGWHLSLIHI